MINKSSFKGSQILKDRNKHITNKYIAFSINFFSHVEVVELVHTQHDKNKKTKKKKDHRFEISSS